ncbi:MFS transporter [Dictyobacter aurantiacus]|uniref:MFS transporter n=1 Tax=Dictyobacter aurantiacus TaxID=1936993 RepID=A0A401ZNA6_9CHLR|nr:MFS transporter [Dictyobacter aurantiacus]GCE08341.1 MFS transporter [Dictyobacter aurantiacus]
MSQTLQQSSTPEPQGTQRINPRILLLALGMFALGTDAFVVAGVLPTIAKETGVTESVAGQLVTVFSLTYGLGAPLFAAFAGRWRPTRVLVGSLGLFFLANVASALSPSFLPLLLTRVLAGCFAATYAPLAYTVGISLAPPAKRGQALALVVIGLTVATALGSPLGTWVGEHFGWRMSFALVALLAGIAVLALLTCGLPEVAASEPLPLKTRLAPITQPRVVMALLPSLLWNIGGYTVYTYIAILLLHNLHISDISGLLVAYGVGVVVGNWSGGMMADRFGTRRLLVLYLVALVIIEALLSLIISTVIAGVVMLFFLGLGISQLFIPQQHRLLSVAPEHANVILALNNSAFYLGIAGGAVVGGLALRVVPVTQLGWIGSAFVLLSLLLYLVSLRVSKSQPLTTADKEAQKVLVAPE